MATSKRILVTRKRQSPPPRSFGHFLRVLRAHLPELRVRYGVQSLGVFGSYVRGDQRPRSDFDVLVEGVHGSLLDFVGLQQELSKRLGVKVDLVPEKNLKPYIGKRVRAEVIWLLKDGQETNARIPRRRHNDKGNGKVAKPKREYLDFLNDILTNMEMAEKFCTGLSNERELYDNPEKAYATAKAVENIGEAVKKVPADVRKKYPQVEWQKIAGMRDRIAHEYFEINYENLWEVVTEDIPRDKPFVKQMVEQERERRRAQEESEQE